MLSSSTNTSPLLAHAVKIRAKNVELRKKISQLQSEIKTIEDDMSRMQVTHDDLLAQSQPSGEKQTDGKQNAQIEAYQRQFDSCIQDISNYLASKTLDLSCIETTSAAPIAAKASVAPTPDKKLDDVATPTSLNDDLNQHLASVENWLMESAVTDIDKQPPMVVETQSTDDGTDDLYNDLIFPSLTDELSSQTEDSPLNENYQREVLIKSISPEQQHKPQRPDKHQRRFALMRQLAEKSNKTVTRKNV